MLQPLYLHLQSPSKAGDRTGISVHTWLFFKLLHSHLGLGTCSRPTPTYPKKPQPLPRLAHKHAPSSGWGRGARSPLVKGGFQGIFWGLLENTTHKEGQALPISNKTPWAGVARAPHVSGRPLERLCLGCSPAPGWRP